MAALDPTKPVKGEIKRILKWVDYFQISYTMYRSQNLYIVGMDC